MKKLLFLFLLFTSSLSIGQIDTLKINELISKQVRDNYFEGTILIADQGEIAFLTSSGFADRDAGLKIGKATKFSIASITKMLTAIITLQLVEEGRLSLHEPINSYLPGFDIPNDGKITVHHLLLHISGLPNEQGPFYQSLKNPEAFVRATIQPSSEIGEIGQFNYANIDYVLLGLIIEQVTGNSWQKEMTDRIINKLGLENTGFLSKENYPEDFAYSYQVSKKGVFIKDPTFYIENFYAAGCMYSDAIDLLKIDRGMYGGTLLSAKSKEIMYTSYPEYNYTGYSVWTYNYPYADAQPLVMERRGGIMGMNVVILRLLESKKTIIILSNNNRFNPDSFGDMKNLREELLIEVSRVSLPEGQVKK